MLREYFDTDLKSAFDRCHEHAEKTSGIALECNDYIDGWGRVRFVWFDRDGNKHTHDVVNHEGDLALFLNEIKAWLFDWVCENC